MHLCLGLFEDMSQMYVDFVLAVIELSIYMMDKKNIGTFIACVYVIVTDNVVGYRSLMRDITLQILTTHTHTHTHRT